MMSQPASACTSACRTSTATVSSLRMSPSAHQAVMAVAGVGIERDVAEHAEIGHFLLDGAHRLADQIVGVQRLASRARRAGTARCRETARCRGCRASRRARRRAPPGRRVRRSTPGIEATGCALVVAVDHEQRPDQIVGGQHVFAHQPPRPFALAIAARADHEIERGGGEGGFPPRRVAQFDRTAEFDRHDIVTPEDSRLERFQS